MAPPITIKFHGQLNDFLSEQQQGTVLEVEYKNTRSVKDLIESIGIPHTEIDIVIRNKESISLTQLVRPGDSIEVYPACTSPDTPGPGLKILHCQPESLADTRFVLDVHLGKLAAYLRMLGFDSLYRNDYEDTTLAEISAQENRILLTCDRRLLMRKQVSYGYFVRHRKPQQQLSEIMARYRLYKKVRPFSRCMRCNGVTHKVSKRSIEANLLAGTKKYYNEFYQCESCNKIYWQGSHYQNMERLIEKWSIDQYK